MTLCQVLREVRKYELCWLPGRRPVKQRGTCLACWAAWGPVSLEQSVKGLSQREEAGGPLCNPVFSTEIPVGLCGIFGTLRKGVSSGHMQLHRCLTWLPRCSLDLNPLRPLAQLRMAQSVMVGLGWSLIQCSYARWYLSLSFGRTLVSSEES